MNLRTHWLVFLMAALFGVAAGLAFAFNPAFAESVGSFTWGAPTLAMTLFIQAALRLPDLSKLADNEDELRRLDWQRQRLRRWIKGCLGLSVLVLVVAVTSDAGAWPTTLPIAWPSVLVGVGAFLVGYAIGFCVSMILGVQERVEAAERASRARGELSSLERRLGGR